MSGHYATINNHKIFGYSRYLHFYNEIVRNAEDGSLFVEVGSFLGQSTAAMGKFIKDSGKNIDFHAIDIFELSEFSDEPHYKAISDHGGDFLSTFINNITLAEVAEYVTPVKAKSTEAASNYADRSISFLMIDASHAYEDVVEDIEAWYPKIKLGGIISGDDYDFEEVSKAVHDCCKYVQIFDRSTWWIRKSFLTLEEHRLSMT